MNSNLDLRVRRTYSCLFNAMLDLLKKSFEDITVNELCERALVGRGTFYKHFSDKYEFFSFALGEMFDYNLKRRKKESMIPMYNRCYTCYLMYSKAKL